MRFTKSERDRLKAEGKWKVSIEPKPLTGVEAFVQGMMSAPQNQVPVPNPNAIPPAIDPFIFTPDPNSVGQVFSEILEMPGFEDNVIHERFPRFDDLIDPIGTFASHYMLAIAKRMVDTSELQEVSNTFRVPEIFMPVEVMPHVKQFGAFNVGDRTAVLSDPQCVVKALLWQSQFCLDEASSYDAFDRLWLPTQVGDRHTDHVLSITLAEWLNRYGVEIGPDDLKGTFFSGLYPDKLAQAIDCLPEAYKEAVPKLFWSYKDAPHFMKFIGSREVLSLLKSIGLSWNHPDVNHLCFNKSLRDVTGFIIENSFGLYIGSKGDKIEGMFAVSSLDVPGSCRQSVGICGDDPDTGFVSGACDVDAVAECLISRCGAYFGYRPRTRVKLGFSTVEYDSIV